MSLSSLILRSVTKLRCAEGCILAISKRAYFVLSNSQMIYPLTTPKQSAAYTVRSKRHTSGDHSKLWPIEKLVTLGLIGVAPAAIINPSLVLDDALSVLLVTHMHWGLENAVVDYVRPIIFGTKIPKLTMALLYLLSFATLGGLLHYNHNCFGIGCTFRKLWEIKY